MKPEHIPLDILYEDEHLIAINKPSGMVVHPAPGSPNGTFVNALLYHLGDEAAEKLLKNFSNGDETLQNTLSELAVKSSSSQDTQGRVDNVVQDENISDFSDFIYDCEDDLNYILSENDTSLSIDLPETPEAAVASPQSLRPGIVHRLDKGDSVSILHPYLSKFIFELHDSFV